MAEIVSQVERAALPYLFIRAVQRWIQADKTQELRASIQLEHRLNRLKAAGYTPEQIDGFTDHARRELERLKSQTHCVIVVNFDEVGE